MKDLGKQEKVDKIKPQIKIDNGRQEPAEKSGRADDKSRRKIRFVPAKKNGRRVTVTKIMDYGFYDRRRCLPGKNEN
jgi:hypothetical protein